MELDYDLKECLDNNPQSYDVKDIDAVLAVYEGQNDEEDWRWVLRLNDNRFVYLRGGCDYTGWDCKSWAYSKFAASPQTAALYELQDDDPKLAVWFALYVQLIFGKILTWREKKDDEFGVHS